MKRFAVAALLFAASVAVAVAADKFKSGPQPGDLIGPFNVVKCNGTTEDGVKIGDELCYYCKYGRKPVVMVFTRDADKTTADLVEKLNELTQKNPKLKAFVNVLAEERGSAEKMAKKLGSSKSVPVVVPNEHTNGPEDYGLNPKAKVTVLLYNNAKIKANFASDRGLTPEMVNAITGEVPSLLK